MTETARRAGNDAPPRTPALDRQTSMRLAETEYDRFAAMLGELSAQDWTHPTECPGWDVRAMAGHVLGMTAMVASVREMVRQQLAAGKRPEEGVDALTAFQVEDRAGLTTAQVVAEMRRLGPRAARGRRRTPGLLRGRRLPELQLVGGVMETWTIGYLIDTILTRDPWMHRIDISRATGRVPHLTADHDGVVVADIVAEWAGRHGQPCEVELTGPAGGRWSFGSQGPTIGLDAVEFTRTVSRREPGTGLLATEVPF